MKQLLGLVLAMAFFSSAFPNLKARQSTGQSGMSFLDGINHEGDFLLLCDTPVLQRRCVGDGKGGVMYELVTSIGHKA